MSVWCEVCAKRENQPENPRVRDGYQHAISKKHGKLEALALCSVALPRQPIESQPTANGFMPIAARTPVSLAGGAAFFCMGLELGFETPMAGSNQPLRSAHKLGGDSLESKARVPGVSFGSPRWLVSALCVPRQPRLLR